ncbi:MAG: cyclic pyranopterin monophosphate synthase MoaC [Pirellula sp.]|nr:cyclic pyranopterin monophosphate synthase MoaC [Pirellula sp.]
MTEELTHFDATGAARMVDVAEKPVTVRIARASAQVVMKPATLDLIRTGGHRKGDVVQVARLAGIMAAKRTSDLIPLCHPLPLEGVDLTFTFLDDTTLGVDATVRCTGRTGVEMEALTSVSVAALTIYDMCKSVDRGMTINSIRLEEKSGGRSGHFVRES